MSALQEQAVRMIGGLSDDNVSFLIEFMQKFMLPKNIDIGVSEAERKEDKMEFMQEMEAMRIKAKSSFPIDFDSQSVWEEAMDGKYSSSN